MTETSSIASNPLPPGIPQPGSIGTASGVEMTIIDQDGRFLPAQQTGEIGGLGRPGCVHELFEAQVAREPNTVALRQGTRQLSYGELNAKANQLAHRLQALGVKPDDRVAILMERSVEMVVGLLAALKAGGACVPLDPADPVQRPSDILEDGAPKVILTQGSVWHRLQEHRGSQPMGVGTAPVLDLEDPTPPWAVKHTGNPQAREAGLTPQHLAYVIYPSGSTGEPKGVVMEHGQLTDLVESRRRTFGTSQACGSNGPAGVTIDAWTWELWSALSDGASLLIAASNELKPIEPVSREQPLPLSFAQQRMWFLAQIEEVSQAYHIPMGFRLLGPLDRAAMQRALGRIVERHEALRTTFLVVNGEPTQHITRPDIDFELQHHDLREHTDATRELQRLSEQEAGARFDLQEGPLIRGRLIQLTASEHVLLLTMHHIVSDRWSMAVLTDELGALYGAFSQGRSDPLPALQIQYPDFAAWQRRWLSGVVQQSQSEYWQHTLQGAPELIELPTDRPRPQRQDHAGGAVEFAFDERLSAGLKALGQRHGMTRFMTLLAVWGAVLVRLSGQDEVVIGTPVANRKRSELEQLIGFFVNTLALRLDSSGSPSVAQWLERVKAQALGAQQHQDLPFEQVVELMHPVRSLAHSPLVQVMFTWEQDSAPDLPGLRTEAVQLGQTIAQFDLTLTLRERGGRIAGNLGYASALFDSGTIERHIEYLRCIASAMVADEAQAIDTLQILPEAERHKLLVQWNDTKVDCPDPRCIHELFETQAARKPNAIALRQGGRQLSYGELNAKANQLAHRLRALGVKPDDRVAVLVERSIEMVIALLATLKAGGAYVPLDPTYPALRLAYMLQDSSPKVILTQGSVWAGLQQHSAPQGVSSSGTPVLDLEDLTPQGAGEHSGNPLSNETGLTAQHLAYVIYTSGSTGQPKGVMVEHSQLANLIDWHHRTFGTTHASCCSALAGIAFDAATWELWSALCAGACLLMPTRESRDDPLKLLNWWQQQPLDISFLPTPLAELAFSEGISNPGLKTFLIGGEALRGRVPSTLGCNVVNNYGPTECAVVATSGLIDAEGGVVHIGRPISNVRAYILDRVGQPVPIGARGELFIGGAGVARGYLDRPELTSERFVLDPFSAERGARMYKSGDLARYLADGNIEFLGRSDSQVKIRGFRIELGEIETKLGACEGVREAVVLAREDTPGEQRLVAYYTAGATDEALRARALFSAEALRAKLAVQLPDYMVPAVFMELPALPLTPNGKLDRKALPPPDAQAYASKKYEAPVGEIETTLARVWRAVLGLERIGRHDNFFELGGHSLKLISLVQRMREAGLVTDARAIFANQTIAALARAIGAGEHTTGAFVAPANRIPEGCAAIDTSMLPLVDLTQAEIDWIVSKVSGGAGNVKDIYPLAPLQEGILFHHMLQAEGDSYLLRLVLAFDNRAVLDRFLGSLQSVIDRHDAMRTAIFWQGLSRPVQVVLRRTLLPLSSVVVPEHADSEQHLLTATDPAKFRLDLNQAPMMAAYVAPMAGSTGWNLALLIHHLVIDHVSLDIVWEEIQAVIRGRADALPAPVQPRNFVAQSIVSQSAEHETYFRTQLGTVDRPTAPYGLIEVHRSQGDAKESHLVLSAALSQRLRRAAKSEGVTAASLFHLAWAMMLARCSESDDVVFGSVLSGRMQDSEGVDRVVGLFINTLPIRLRLADQGVKLALAETHRRLFELVQHERTPLALAQRCSAVPATLPLVCALLNYRHGTTPLFSPRDGMAIPRALAGIRKLKFEERTNYPITLCVDDLSKGFEVTAQCVGGPDPKRIVEYVRTALGALVDALERAPETPVASLGILPAHEIEESCRTWNNAAVRPYPAQQAVQQVFETRAAEQPNAVALVHGSRQLTYSELNAQANRLAHYLVAQGVRPGEYVATFFDRSVELVVAQLAVLKCGAAYVPIDTGVPANRFSYLIDDCGCRVLLSELAQQTPSATNVLRIDVDQSLTGSFAARNPMPEVAADAAAYVMYTSGSTGQPKGVVTPHRAITRLVLNNGYADFAADDRVACAANPAFDASTFEIWAPLLNGGRAVVIDQDIVLDPARFARTLLQQSVNVLWLTVGLFNQYADDLADVLPHLRYLIVGGDVLDPHVIAKVLRRGRPQHLLNGYGPTESTTFATTFEIDSVLEETASIPIGRPISNTRVYILDRHGAPVPIGATGELFIGGDGLALGYLNRPELTAECFVADPFCGKSGARMYRSGDLARYRDNGVVEFLGRHDSQVKIRGFRIELGEIEAQLANCPGVRECAVVALETETAHKRLVAYYASAGEVCDAATLRERLLALLPEYMVPSAYVLLPGLPLTPNGKLDRRALPAPEATALLFREHEPPVGEIETLLAQVWAEVLKLERIGRNDNFFELGGHSLLATRLISKVRDRLGIELPLRALFDAPVLAAVADAVALAMNAATGTAAPKLPAISRQPRDRLLPTSYSQRRMWLVQQFNPQTTAYNMSFPLRLRGPLDRIAMTAALDRLVDRHEAFRTTFVAVDGEPMQRTESRATAPIEWIDLSSLRKDERIAAAHSALRERSVVPFDLALAPLHRITLLRLDETDHVFFWSIHHSIGDAWSFSILFRELANLYSALARGEEISLPTNAIEYADYAAWQRQVIAGAALEPQMAYWREALQGLEPLPLPLDHPRRGAHDGRGSRVSATISPQTLAGIKALGLQHGVTPFMVLLACFQLQLARSCGVTDVAVGTPIANRTHTASESVVGTLVNTLVMRNDFSGNPSFAELLHRVRTTALQAFAHQDLPFEAIVESLATARTDDVAPLVQVLFNVLDAPTDGIRLDCIDIELFDFDGGTSQFDLGLSIETAVFGNVRLSFSDQLFDLSTAKRILAGYLNLLDQVVEAPSTLLADFELVGAEGRQLMQSWNGESAMLASPIAQSHSIHGVLEQQANRTPTRTAASTSTGSLTYSELQRRSNKLARVLRSRGIGRGALVGLCVERSLDMVIAQLAILKSGAAYVPLDPAYPQDRLSAICEDAQMDLLITASEIRTPYWPHHKCLLLDHHSATITLQSGAPLAPDSRFDAGPQSPAYVIYTSGSTGKPKGVVVPHAAVVNFLASMAKEPGLNASDILVAVTTLSFDIAVLELLLPLSVGAQVVLATSDEATDGRELRRLIELHRASVMQATPSTWRMLIEAGWRGSPSFKALIGGEALPSDLADQLVARCGELWNMYGPTETTVWSSCWSVQHPERGISIGRPIANTQIHILDERRKLCPIGATGEIYIGGAGVALGYLNRPELTAERFIADPFSAVPEARLYRTGDRGRWRYDGWLEHQGRLDHQVKVRGHRIELGDIEAHLSTHPAVAHAVVIVREDQPGDVRLVAYVRVHDEAPPSAALREHLRARLPEYMVPQHFVVIDRLPLLPNGKLNRQALPAPAETTKDDGGFAVGAPETRMERAIAHIWEELLGVTPIGLRDNFFDLGGHSLLAMRAVAAIEQQHGLKLNPRRLVFETLAQLSAGVDEPSVTEY